MNRTRHTITLDPSVLSLVDARIDGHEIRNRSQAIEQLLLQQLVGNGAGIVLLSGGNPVRHTQIESGYPLFAVGDLASNQLPPHTVLPGEFGAATSLALSRDQLPATLVVIDLDAPGQIPGLRTLLAGCSDDALVTSVYQLGTEVHPLSVWVVRTEALDLLPSGNRAMADLVQAAHAKGGHRGYLHVH